MTITIADETLDASAEAELEAAAVGYLNVLEGVRVESEVPLILALAVDRPLPAVHLAEVLRRGLRLEFPRLGPISVAITAPPAALAEEVAAVRHAREVALQQMADADLEVVFTCEACAPFAASTSVSSNRGARRCVDGGGERCWWARAT